jgi:hypothetical protein
MKQTNMKGNHSIWQDLEFPGFCPSKTVFKDVHEEAEYEVKWINAKIKSYG